MFYRVTFKLFYPWLNKVDEHFSKLIFIKRGQGAYKNFTNISIKRLWLLYLAIFSYSEDSYTNINSLNAPFDLSYRNVIKTPLGLFLCNYKIFKPVIYIWMPCLIIYVFYRAVKRKKFYCSNKVHPQTIAVVETRAR